ncbi:MAG: proprotein convertase P-domain-containing protein, partial [Myxococcota bacterium]|nr:proprotein convertase P-domain-containing protein [Myxococcota bacterium]
GVTVQTDPELPRQRLGSSPYAIHAGSASALACTGCLEVDALSQGARDALRAEALQAVEDAGFAKQTDVTVNEENLPTTGLNEISGGLLTTELSHVFAQPAPLPIPDQNPFGVSSVIDVPPVGLLRDLRVHVDISNSDMTTLTVELHDPNGQVHVLYAQDGPGDGLVATYPDPDAPLAGNLEAWIGGNPAGTWTLEVVDDGFLNNTFDGQINAWSMELVVLSNSVVRATSNLEVIGDLDVGGGATVAANLGVGGDVTIGKGDAPCTPETAGTVRYEPSDGRLFICTGQEFLKIKACSTACLSPAEVECSLPITDGCDDPCEGVGEGLSTSQCLLQAANALCNHPVTDVCGNDCGLVGSLLDTDACPDPASVDCGAIIIDPCGNACGTTGEGLVAEQCPASDAVQCGEPVLDPCGNACGGDGTALNPSLCGDPSSVPCGTPIQDSCGNDCGSTGTQCASGACTGEGVCSSINVVGSIRSGSEYFAPIEPGYFQCAGFRNTNEWDILTTDWVHSCASDGGKRWLVRVYDPFNDTVLFEDQFPSYTQSELDNNLPGCNDSGYGTCGKSSVIGTGRALLVYKPNNGNGGCHGDDNSVGAFRVANTTDGSNAMGNNFVFVGGRHPGGGFRSHNHGDQQDSELRFIDGISLWDGCSHDGRQNYAIAVYLED